MHFGPIFRHELRVAARHFRPFGTRIIVAGLLGTTFVLIALQILGWDRLRRSDYEWHELRAFGAWAFVLLIGLELLILAFLVPATVAGTIAEEREKDTLWQLLLTRLTPA